MAVQWIKFLSLLLFSFCLSLPALGQTKNAKEDDVVASSKSVVKLTSSAPEEADEKKDDEEDKNKKEDEEDKDENQSKAADTKATTSSSDRAPNHSSNSLDLDSEPKKELNEGQKETLSSLQEAKRLVNDQPSSTHSIPSNLDQNNQNESDKAFSKSKASSEVFNSSDQISSNTKTAEETLRSSTQTTSSQPSFNGGSDTPLISSSSPSPSLESTTAAADEASSRTQGFGSPAKVVAPVELTQGSKSSPVSSRTNFGPSSVSDLNRSYHQSTTTFNYNLASNASPTPSTLAEKVVSELNLSLAPQPTREQELRDFAADDWVKLCRGANDWTECAKRLVRSSNVKAATSFNSNQFSKDEHKEAAITQSVLRVNSDIDEEILNVADELNLSGKIKSTPQEILNTKSAIERGTELQNQIAALETLRLSLLPMPLVGAPSTEAITALQKQLEAQLYAVKKEESDEKENSNVLSRMFKGLTDRVKEPYQTLQQPQQAQVAESSLPEKAEGGSSSLDLEGAGSKTDSIVEANTQVLKPQESLEWFNGLDKENRLRVCTDLQDCMVEMDNRNQAPEAQLNTQLAADLDQNHASLNTEPEPTDEEAGNVEEYSAAYAGSQDLAPEKGEVMSLRE